MLSVVKSYRDIGVVGVTVESTISMHTYTYAWQAHKCKSYLRGPDTEACGTVPDAVSGAVDRIDEGPQARGLGPVEDVLGRRVVPVQVDLTEDGLVLGLELADLLDRQVGVVGVLLVPIIPCQRLCSLMCL